MTATFTVNPWLEYTDRRLNDDRQTLQEVVYDLTQPHTPQDAWKPLAAVAARLATAQGAGVREFFAHVADAIVHENRGEVDPVIVALDHVIGGAA